MDFIKRTFQTLSQVCLRQSLLETWGLEKKCNFGIDCSSHRITQLEKASLTLYSTSVVLNQGQYCPPVSQEHMAMCGDTFGHHSVGWGKRTHGATGI